MMAGRSGRPSRTGPDASGASDGRIRAANLMVQAPCALSIAAIWCLSPVADVAMHPGNP